MRSKEGADGKRPQGNFSIAGTSIAAGVAGNVLAGGVAEAGDKITTVVEKLGELKFDLV
jgi:hypothetical protein